MKKYLNKYRIESARAQWWDYSSNAAYFVTICTQKRINFFGDISEEEMILTEIGMAAQLCWSEIPQHFSFVKLGVSIVMPNHIHGIIMIEKPVETQNFASLQPYQPLSKPLNKFGPQSQNLASIVRGYKIGVSKMAKIIDPDFKWQPRFHDHIIRSDQEYQRITDYMESNPLNWQKDSFFKSGK